MKKRRTREDFYRELNTQSIKSYDFSFPAKIIPYTIEEALDDLREGEVEIIQYTVGNGGKRLMRFNQGRNSFESSFLNSNGADWFKEHSSYSQMKTWKHISIYTEERKEKKNSLKRRVRELEDEIERLKDNQIKEEKYDYVYINKSIGYVPRRS